MVFIIGAKHYRNAEEGGRVYVIVGYRGLRTREPERVGHAPPDALPSTYATLSLSRVVEGEGGSTMYIDEVAPRASAGSVAFALPPDAGGLPLHNVVYTLTEVDAADGEGVTRDVSHTFTVCGYANGKPRAACLDPYVNVLTSNATMYVQYKAHNYSSLRVVYDLDLRVRLTPQPALPAQAGYDLHAQGAHRELTLTDAHRPPAAGGVLTVYATDFDVSSPDLRVSTAHAVMSSRNVALAEYAHIVDIQRAPNDDTTTLGTYPDVAIVTLFAPRGAAVYMCDTSDASPERPEFHHTNIDVGEDGLFEARIPVRLASEYTTYLLVRVTRADGVRVMEQNVRVYSHLPLTPTETLPVATQVQYAERPFVAFVDAHGAFQTSPYNRGGFIEYVNAQGVRVSIYVTPIIKVEGHTAFMLDEGDVYRVADPARPPVFNLRVLYSGQPPVLLTVDMTSATPPAPAPQPLLSLDSVSLTHSLGSDDDDDVASRRLRIDAWTPAADAASLDITCEGGTHVGRGRFRRLQKTRTTRRVWVSTNPCGEDVSVSGAPLTREGRSLTGPRDVDTYPRTYTLTAYNYAEHGASATNSAKKSRTITVCAPNVQCLPSTAYLLRDDGVTWVSVQRVAADSVVRTRDARTTRVLNVTQNVCAHAAATAEAGSSGHVFYQIEVAPEAWGKLVIKYGPPHHTTATAIELEA